MAYVPLAAIGPQLDQAGDIGAGDQAAHASRGVVFRRMRSGVAQAPETKDLGSDEQQVAVYHLVRLGNEEPGVIAAAEVPEQELPVAVGELGVQG